MEVLGKVLGATVNWRGYIVWGCALALFLIGAINGDQFAIITAGVAAQKGLEGAGRNFRRS